MRLNIRNKTLLITSFGIIVVSTFFILLHIYTLQKMTDENLREFFAGFEEKITMFFKKEAQNISIMTEYSIAKKSELIKDFVNSKRDALYKKTLPFYDTLQKKYHGNLSIMHYYKPGAKSFLRMHKPEKYGDVTKDHRPMLAHIDDTKTHDIQTGFEAGRFSFAYRVEVPLFLDDEYIGIMDYGLEANELINAISEESNTYMAITMPKNSAEPIKFHKYKKEEGDIILYSSTHSIFAALQNISLQKKIEYIAYKGRSFALYSVPLDDFYGNPIAHCIIAKDITALDDEIRNNIYIWLFLALLLILLNITFFNKSFTPMIKKLTEQKNLLSRAQSLAHLGYIEIDLKTWDVLCSKEFYKIAGMAKDAKTDFQEIMQILHPDDVSRFEENVRSAAKTGYFEELKSRVLTPDKEERILYIQGEVTYNKKEKNPAKITCVALDITETEHLVWELKQLNLTLKRRIEEEVEKRRRQELLLVEQYRLASMGELVQSISHHWRQPLAAVSLIVQDIEEAYAYDELDKEYVASSVRQAQKILEKMSCTIDHFREFVKKDKEKEYFDAIRALDDTVSLHKEALLDDGINLIYEKSIMHTGEALVSGYPSEFKQAISNIIHNAKDAIMLAPRPNPKTITIVIEKIDKKLVITISDTGGGIQENIIGKIFDPYFTTHEQGNGLGIGLYMVKTLLEKHMHGTVSAKNTENGAKFVISLDSD